MDEPRESHEIVLQPVTSRKQLEPIKEDEIYAPNASQLETADLGGKRFSLRLDKSLPSVDLPFKICPFTKTECPSKVNPVKRDSITSSFDTVSADSDASDKSNRTYGSLLERPFIFRNADSLQRAVEHEQQVLEDYLRRMAENAVQVEERFDEGPKPPPADVAITMDTKSQTDTTDSSSYTGRRLNYLMGISTEKGEEEGKPASEKDISFEQLDKSLTGETQAMRQAQRYLRVHRIFEFYQFLVAHLLSALPINPINFLLGLLDKCIVYRAGIGNPPLLYDRKHLEALFNLMDRMRTGFITKEQYVTGMKTLGICSYNPNPPTVEGNWVHKNFFIEEAYENLVSLLNDIIRRRWIYFNNQPMPTTTPPPTPQISAPTTKTSLRRKPK